MENNIIQAAAAKKAPAAKAAPSVNAIMNSVLDGQGMRKRFQELLGERTPQFLSSIVTMVNGDPALQRAMMEAPVTVIQAALKGATFDLPIDPALGYGYVVAFKNNKKQADGSKQQVTEAAYILGYKGMIQLCLRTGAYSRIPEAVDVREGELVKYDRLTGDAEFAWIDDEDAREKLPVIGYAGYFRLKNGAEKYIYMTVNQIRAHEKKNRKGEYMSKGWRDDFDSMARKTIIRKLCGRYGLMSIAYQNGDRDTVNLATALAEQPDDDLAEDLVTVDEMTVEVNE